MVRDAEWAAEWIEIRNEFIYWGGRAKRATQDSPVLPEVWEQFFRKYYTNPSGVSDKTDSGAVELLLTPHAKLGVRTLGRRFQERCEEHLKQQHTKIFSDDSMAPLQIFAPTILFSASYIVTQLTFEQMVILLLPMTAWWDKHVSPHVQGESMEKLRLYRKEQLSIKTKALPVDTLDRDLTAIPVTFLWTVRLLGILYRLQEISAQPSSKTEKQQKLFEEKEFCKQLTVITWVEAIDSFLRLLALILPYPVLKEEAASGLYPLWQVGLNREAKPTVARSSLTVKADAARTLFNVSCSNLVWAIVDGGIDATHPAFQETIPPPVAPGKTGNVQKSSNTNSVSTRIVQTYDFWRLKREPALWYGDSDDEPVIIEPGKEQPSFDPAFPKRKGKVLETQEETHLWQCLHAARMSSLNLKRLKSISDVIDWEDVSTKIKVPHDGNYPVPKGEHGTHVAGILGANWPSNPDLNSLPEGQDIVGMCPDIKFYDLRVFADTSNGEEGIFGETKQVTDEFTVICALEFIRFLNRKREELKVHGVNLSLSIPHDVASFACGCTPVCNECARLVDAGVVVVAAAGNHGFDERSIPFSQGGEYRDISISDPGNAEEAITVGSTHRDHPHTYGISYFSGRGPTGDGRRKPDLVAPGEKIIAPVPGERFACKDGTSMAAPHVSGAAALLMARYPELIGNPRRIKQILCETATDLGRERYFQGHGLLDVLRAMQSL
ncbi:MAG TPA: S8 family serine peptidase [Candidatus Hydrogenedentes bacterium]|nr:S8 family serine peptidase [Candidatus Hydrogenedentota bacterium]